MKTSHNLVCGQTNRRKLAKTRPPYCRQQKSRSAQSVALLQQTSILSDLRELCCGWRELELWLLEMSLVAISAASSAFLYPRRMSASSGFTMLRPGTPNSCTHRQNSTRFVPSNFNKKLSYS